MGTPRTYNSNSLFKIALLCLVLYSLRSDALVVKGDNVRGVGIRRIRGSPAPSPTPSPPTALSSAWRRRMVQRGYNSSETNSSSSQSSSQERTHLMPDDFINLTSNSAAVDPSDERGTLPLTGAFYPVSSATQKIFADPFKLQGTDNVLQPTPDPARKKVFRRTRRRRVKKLRAGDASSTKEPSSVVTEEEVTTEELGSVSPTASTESVNKFKYLTTVGRISTLKPTLRSTGSSTTMKLAVVPIDSMMEGITDEEATLERSASLPTTGPTAASPPGMKNIRPGFYTGHQQRGRGGERGRGRKRAKSKENLWKVDSPNLSVELFDNVEATDDLNNSNLDKRESPSKRTTSPSFANHNMFTLRPTALSSLLSEGDMSTDESIVNSFVNTSVPISTELQNALQFKLQSLHPLLNSDSVLTQKEPKIPENKTVAITHSLAETPVDTPVAPDLRFLPAHLRKSHPLLSQEIFLEGGLGGLSGSGSKLGPRLNVHPHYHHNHGMHSIRNDPSSSTTTTRGSTTTRGTTSTTTERNKSPSTSSTPRSTTSTTRHTTTTTTSTEPSTSISTTRRTTTTRLTSRIPPTSPKTAYPTSPNLNVHLESLGNLRITELVYPTNSAPAQSAPDLKYVDPPPRRASTTAATISSSYASTKTTGGTTSSTTVRSPPEFALAPSTKQPASSSRRPSPILETTDSRSPPMILMGSDSASDSSIGSAIESPPAFDDLLLEELIRGFVPPKPSTTTTSTTSTTTTTTTTTPKPTTRRTTTTTTTTTTTPPPPPPPPKPAQDDETQQLLQLLSLLQPSSSTTAKSTSPLSTSTTNKVDEDILKNLALLENLLSPTAKTMIKDAVDSGTTQKIKTSADGQGLSNADLHQIFMLLDAMSTTTTTTTTTTTPRPPQVIHPALQNMLNMLTNPVQQQQQQQQHVQKPVFTIPEPPKPVPTTSSFDLLSQLFNLNGQQQQPKPAAPSLQGTFGSALGGLFESFLPKRAPANREATASASNPLLSFFQPPAEPVATPAPGPYYWFDVNAFMGQDPNAGPMSGIRPKFGTRDYFLKVRKRRNSMERF